MDNTTADKRQKVVLSIGRLTKDKRYSDLITVWSKLVPEFPDWNLTIIGTGEMHSSLIRLINKNNLSSSIRLIRPLIDIESYLLSASVFAITSRYEGFSLVLIEAMHAFLPVVSFKVYSGPAELISDGDNGLLAKDGDLEHFARLLRQLMTSDQYRSQLGQAARVFSTQFLPQYNRITFMNAFNSLI
jgi:glycosyltransferase involved in cell wall biosynthesis